MTGHEGADKLALHGWDVLAVGRRQAWLFLTFGSPDTDRTERTIWIDTDFTVTDSNGHSRRGRSDGDGTPLALLEPLATLYVEEVELGEDDLRLRFDDGSTLTVANRPNARDSQGWWV